MHRLSQVLGKYMMQASSMKAMGKGKYGKVLHKLAYYMYFQELGRHMMGLYMCLVLYRKGMDKCSLAA